MKVQIFSFFFFILVFSSLVGASLQLDRGSLVFSLGLNERACKTVRISSGDYFGGIQIKDIWAGTPDEARNFGAYNFTSEDHGLSISYAKPISNLQNSVDEEVCLEGSKLGDYKGAIIFTPESSEQINVEIGTWLLVHVSENPQELTEKQMSVFSSGSGSGSSALSGQKVSDETVSKTNGNFDTLAYTREGQQEASSPIIGTVVNEDGSSRNTVISIIVIFIVAIALAMFFIQRRRRIARNPWLNSQY
ncbi:hypothetical protein J4233_04510 [Candidatus Pacearchaeota archaeon]|nr:hypothetical protein [Candidatus Pacearchaeota archaeon]